LDGLFKLYSAPATHLPHTEGEWMVSGEGVGWGEVGTG